MKKRLAYPFLYEASRLVDYEILTDKLASTIAHAASFADDFPAFKKELIDVTAMTYHLNGSIRGKLGVTEADLSFLMQQYALYEQKTHALKKFVLPQGTPLATNLHIARSMAKEVVRMMHIIKQDDTFVDPLLFDIANALSDYLFVVSLYANKLAGVKEIPFESRSY